MKKGLFYVVATPIGNLDDITFRAVETLKSVDIILAEDTRYTSKLLKKFSIETKVISYRDQNHLKMVNKIIDFLNGGLNLALVSDSGTPLISDPGFKLVKELRDLAFEVYSIPGPSALTSSLSISGMPTDKFVFIGFMPKSSGKREKILEAYGSLDVSIVVYESPYRVVKLLESIVGILGADRMIFVAKDLTKLHEKHFYGRASEVLEILKESTIKGEFVVVISKE